MSIIQDNLVHTIKDIKNYLEVKSIIDRGESTIIYRITVRESLRILKLLNDVDMTEQMAIMLNENIRVLNKFNEESFNATTSPLDRLGKKTGNLMKKYWSKL